MAIDQFPIHFGKQIHLAIDPRRQCIADVAVVAAIERQAVRTQVSDVKRIVAVAHLHFKVVVRTHRVQSRRIVACSQIEKDFRCRRDVGGVQNVLAAPGFDEHPIMRRHGLQADLVRVACGAGVVGGEHQEVSLHVDIVKADGVRAFAGIDVEIIQIIVADDGVRHGDNVVPNASADIEDAGGTRVRTVTLSQSNP